MTRSAVQQDVTGAVALSNIPLPAALLCPSAMLSQLCQSAVVALVQLLQTTDVVDEAKTCVS